MIRSSASSGPSADVAGASPATVAPSNAIESSTIAPHTARAVDREQRIAQAAYYLAEQRGFAPGGAIDDWLTAEREIDQA